MSFAAAQGRSKTKRKVAFCKHSVTAATAFKSQNSTMCVGDFLQIMGLLAGAGFLPQREAAAHEGGGVPQF